MKFYFYWIKNQEIIDASPSFKKEAKRFLTPMFERTVYHYFDKRLLELQAEGLPLLLNDTKTLAWDKVAIKLGSSSGLLFTCQLLYRHRQGLIIRPYDLVEHGSLKFEIRHFPDEEQLLAIQDSWSVVLKDTTKSRLIDCPFRFPFREKRTCMPPDVRLRIKTSAESQVLEDLLGRSMNEWNEANTLARTKSNGLIHDLWVDKAVRDEKIIAVDLGSSSEAGLLHLLRVLDQSNLLIRNVILE